MARAKPDPPAAGRQPDAGSRNCRACVHSLLEAAPDAAATIGSDGVITDVNRRLEELAGRSRDALIGTPLRECFTEPGRAAEGIRLAREEGRGEVHELTVRGPEGREAPVSLHVAVVHDEQGRPQGLLGTVREVAEQRRAAAELRVRARQQQAAAEFSQQALAEPDLDALMEAAVGLLAATLDVEYAKVLELAPGGEELVLRAGAGFESGLVGSARIPAGARSQAGYVLESGSSVAVDDLSREARFSPASLLVDHGVVSGLSVAIPGEDGPFGVLGAHSTRRRAFTDDDLHFVETLANALGAAIRRKRVEETLRHANDLLETMSSSINVLIAYMDTDFDFLRVNDAYARADGRTPDYYPGKNHFALFPNTQNEVIFREVVATGTPYVFFAKPFEYAEHPERGVTYWDWSVQPVKGPDGEVTGVVLSLVNVTERMRAQVALREATRLLQGIADNTPTVVWVTDADGRLMWVNRQFERLYGLAAEEAIGRSRYELVAPDVAQAGRANDREVLATKSVRSFEETIPEDGSARTYVSVGFPLVDEHGDAYAIGGVSTDITERKRMEEELRRLSAELEQRVAERTADLEASNHELEAFAYSVSHDLRAPLRAIDGFSHAVVETCGDELGEQGREDLGRVRAAAQRMGVLIDEVLRLSRVGRAEMHRETVDLSALARAIGGELRRAEPEREVELAIQDGITARGDPTLLRLVLQNLLGNAWKFTAPHATARIELGTRVQEGETVCFVRDDGIGFDMAYAEKLFIPFQRLHSAAEFPGTGIGLATVQRIVRRHGGRVWAQAAVDEGATFSFTLEGLAAAPA